MIYLFYIIITGILLSLPWRFAGEESVIPVLLGWVSIFFLIKISKLKHSFLAGYFVGIIFYAISFSWALNCLTDYFLEASQPTLYIFYTLFVLYHALQFVLFYFLYQKTNYKILKDFSLRFPISFCTSEFLFYKIFPISIAHSQANFIIFAELASIFGIYTVSFFMFWIAENFLNFIKNKKIINAIIPLLILSFVFFYGTYKIKFYNQNNFPLQHFVLIQDKNVHDKIMANYYYDEENELTNKIDEKINNNLSPIFIMPESSYDLMPNKKNLKLPEIEKIKKEASFIIGSHTIDDKENIFNSIIIIDKNNKYNVYDKTKLLPFGEKVPFASLLNHFGIKPYDELEVFDGVQNKSLHIVNDKNEIIFAPMICYEDIIPNVILKNIEKNTNILISISNDAWFTGLAKKQHAFLASWRAIETGKYFVRTSTGGISFVSSPLLKTIKSLGENKNGYVEVDVPLIKGETIYTTINDTFWWILTGIMVLLTIKSYRKNKA